MHILIVHLVVRPEYIEEFKQAAFDNSTNSRKEPGVVRFDILQQPDAPTHFALFEVYHDPEGHRLHRETAHFKRWQEISAPMIAERKALVFNNLLPGDETWVKT